MDAPTPRIPIPHVLASVVGVLLLGLTGLVSCRSAASPSDRPPIPPDPELVRVPATSVLVAPVPVYEPSVRVRVRAGVGSVRLAGDRLALIVDDRGREWRAATPARISRTAEGFLIRPDRGSEVRIASGLLLLDGADIDGAHLPGRVEIAARESAASLDVIAELPLESYVTGVVAREVFPSWPAETLRAQAVAARSYALHTRALARRDGRGHDLEATTVDQAFDGVSTDRRVVAAVRATRGRVMAHAGEVLRTYYHSTSGGRSAGAAEVWPTRAGFEYNLATPLQADSDANTRVHASDASPSHRWTRERGRERLSLRIRRFGEEQGRPTKHLRTLARVEVIEANATGRPVRYRLHDTRGRTAELSAEELRLACNWSVPGVPDITRQTRVRSGDLSMRVDGSRVFISGRGFGHGVGMCQYSAAGLAERGWTHERILRNFYPGAEILDAYE